VDGNAMNDTDRQALALISALLAAAIIGFVMSMIDGRLTNGRASLPKAYFTNQMLAPLRP
jgi:hypothetical protein